MKNLPVCCTKCAACKRGQDVSTDGFDRAVELWCGFTNTIIDSFYEHPGAERVDREIMENCPLKG